MHFVSGYDIPSQKRIRVVISSDMANEADDHASVAEALLSPSFEIEALLAAHFGRPGSRDESRQEISRLLELFGIGDDIVFDGADMAFSGSNGSNSSPASHRIASEALKNDERKLFILALGPLTDIAAALLEEPAVAKRATLVWVGGESYPDGGWEYNLANDPAAANIVFSSGMEIWQIPRKTYAMMAVGIAELYVRLHGHGAVSAFILDRVLEWNMLPSGAYRSGEAWTFGDSSAVGVLIYPHPYDWKVWPAPVVGKDLWYVGSSGKGNVRVLERIDSRLVLEDLFSKLSLAASGHFVPS